MPKTYNDLYLATRTALKSAGVEAYALEARLLVAYAVGKVEQEIRSCGQHVELLTHGGGYLFRPFVLCPARQNLPVERQQCPLALADLGGKVLATVFHVGEKHVLLGNVAVVRRLQNGSKARGGKLVGHVAPPFKVEHGRQAAARFRLLRGKRLTLARARFGRSSEKHYVHPPNVSKPSIPSSSLGRTPHGL